MFLATPTSEKPSSASVLQNQTHQVRNSGRKRKSEEEDEEIIVHFEDDARVLFKEGWKLAIGQSSTVYRGFFFANSSSASVECAVKLAHADEDSLIAVEHERHVLSKLEDAPVMRLIAYRKGVSVFDLAPMTLVRAVERQLLVMQRGDVIGWIRQLFEAISYLHERGVVHGDLKPHNVLIDANGCIKLCDFGNALVTSEANEYPSSGTTAYTPPEALSSCSFQGFLEKRDVYAAGLTSYFMMTGRVPFKSHGSPVRLIVAIRQGFMECGDNGVPGDLYAQNPRLYGKLMAFWQQCTQKQPENRPTAHEALKILSSLREESIK